MKINWPTILAVYFLGFLANPQFGVAAEIRPMAGLRRFWPSRICAGGGSPGELWVRFAGYGTGTRRISRMHRLNAYLKATEHSHRTALAAGLAGRVSFAVQYGARLPYADDLLNLLVVDDYPALRHGGVSLPEILRVVAPFNTVVFGGVTDQAALGRELGRRPGIRRTPFTSRATGCGWSNPCRS